MYLTDNEILYYVQETYVEENVKVFSGTLPDTSENMEHPKEELSITK